MNKKFISIVTATALSTTLFAGMALAKPPEGGPPGHSKKSAVHSTKASNGKDFNAPFKNSGETKERFNAEIKEKVKEQVKQKLKAQKNERKLSKLKDVDNHWAEGSIERLQLMGVVGGYQDGTFKPENEVTEVEAISLIMRLFGDIYTEEDDVSVDENDESNNNEEEQTEDTEDEVNDEDEATDDEEQDEDTEDEATDDEEQDEDTEDVATDDEEDDHKNFNVEIKDGKIEISDDDSKFEYKDGKIEYVSENGKMEIKEDKIEVKGDVLEEFQEKMETYKEIIDGNQDVMQALEELDKQEEDTDEDEFSDVPDWAHESVAKAAKKNVINMNRFHSHVQASRAQATVWIAKAMDLEPVDTSHMQFNDGILISPEDAGYIMAMVEEGIIVGSSDGNFNPNSAISRAEMAVILDRILQEEDEEQDSEENTDNNEVDENTEEDVNEDDSSDEEDSEDSTNEDEESEQ
ncbi:MAG: S-layer homology domain-containing protein [Firmicutes bacterium]|nr:S-layer homology domain-containing protein [Bacillota bacterium]